MTIRGPLGTLAVLTLMALGGCASTPADTIVDRLDPDTATTVSVIADPVQLVADTVSGAGVADPFAYLAPFETDRAGERALFLWISAPQNSGALDPPKVTCDGQPLTLQALPTDLAELKLAKAPYALPAPWSSQWYFKLPPESLRCLGAAAGVGLETTRVKGDPERFSASGKALTPLKAFAGHSTN